MVGVCVNQRDPKVCKGLCVCVRGICQNIVSRLNSLHFICTSLHATSSPASPYRHHHHPRCQAVSLRCCQPSCDENHASRSMIVCNNANYFHNPDVGFGTAQSQRPTRDRHTVACSSYTQHCGMVAGGRRSFSLSRRLT